MSVAQQAKVLPQWVNPLKLAAQDNLFDGVVPPERMLRLSELTLSVDRPITASLHFHCDETGYRVVTGDLGAELQLVCQRCMKSMTHRIAATVSWIIVIDEEKIGSLPKHYEPWLLDDSDADLYGMIEEELLLELPIVSFHDLNQCEAEGRYSTGKVEMAKRPNPFEVLQGLKLKE